MVKLEVSNKKEVVLLVKTAGVLFLNRDKGSNVKVYSFVEGLEPVLIGEESSNKKNVFLRLETEGVSYKVVSETEIVSAYFTGECKTAAPLVLCFSSWGNSETGEAGIEYDEDFRLGDTIYDTPFMFFTEEQYEKLGDTFIVSTGLETREYQKDVCVGKLHSQSAIDEINNFFGNEIADEDLYYFDAFLELSMVATYYGVPASLTFTYNGEEIVYKIGVNWIIKGRYEHHSS